MGERRFAWSWSLGGQLLLGLLAATSFLWPPKWAWLIIVPAAVLVAATIYFSGRELAAAENRGTQRDRKLDRIGSAVRVADEAPGDLRSECTALSSDLWRLLISLYKSEHVERPEWTGDRDADISRLTFAVQQADDRRRAYMSSAESLSANQRLLFVRETLSKLTTADGSPFLSEQETRILYAPGVTNESVEQQAKCLAEIAARLPES